MVGGILVSLNVHFNVLRETLERVGFVNTKTNTFYPSCYLLHKKSRETNESEYYIIHFKKLFELDGRKSNFDENDDLRQTAIAKLMEKWGLVTILDNKNLREDKEQPFLNVLSHEDKEKYTIVHKYKIGNVKGKVND